VNYLKIAVPILDNDCSKNAYTAPYIEKCMNAKMLLHKVLCS